MNNFTKYEIQEKFPMLYYLDLEDCYVKLTDSYDYSKAEIVPCQIIDCDYDKRCTIEVLDEDCIPEEPHYGIRWHDLFKTKEAANEALVQTGELSSGDFDFDNYEEYGLNFDDILKLTLSRKNYYRFKKARRKSSNKENYTLWTEVGQIRAGEHFTSRKDLLKAILKFDHEYLEGINIDSNHSLNQIEFFAEQNRQFFFDCNGYMGVKTSSKYVPRYKTYKDYQKTKVNRFKQR